MSITVHPKFTENGRFFASFNCDKTTWLGCSGRCACNSDVNCDPSKLSPDNGAQPCQYHSIVAEFTVNGTISQSAMANDKFDEVDIITKGGNFGWHVYEGPYLYTRPTSRGENTSLNSINPIFPVMGYKHSAVNSKAGSASITGGYFYRSSTDPCVYGRYLYSDLYGHDIWECTEVPEDSGNFSTSQLPFSCAADSPVQCSSVPCGSTPALGYVFSFGEDPNKDFNILTSSVVYRVVQLSSCKYTCWKEKSAASSTAAPSSSRSQNSLAMQLSNV